LINNNIIPSIGLYEKALPDNIDWERRLSMIRDAGYRFMELSIDQTDERLERLRWDVNKINKLRIICRDIKIPIKTMCLSANRSFPIGSSDTKLQEKGIEIILDAIKFAFCMGIRIIQIASFDVLDDEKSTDESRNAFISNLRKCVRSATSHGIMLAIENVDCEFGASLDNIDKVLKIINSPWLKMYPDIGNTRAAGLDVNEQLKKYMRNIVAVHVKDTIPGIYRNIPFGHGIVDFVSAFKTLKKSNYCGPMLLEMWSNSKENQFGVIKYSIEWISEKLGDSGYIIR
jgi:L-ribulose-5-phosphate 3-epimerase